MRGAQKGIPRAKDWLTTDVKSLCVEWSAGIPTADLAKKYGRTERAIEVMARDCRARRPIGFRRPSAWLEIQNSLALEKMQTVGQLVITTGMWKATIIRVIKEHRQDLRVAKWVDSDRTDGKGKLKALWAIGPGKDAPKPREQKAARKDINPFASVLGLVEVPKGNPGRVFIHLTDSPEEKLEAA